MKKVILLARVSTDQQDYVAQISELREYIKKDGYSDDQIIEITGHESATLLEERKTLNEIYSKIESENVVALYCTDLMRLSRKGKILTEMFYDFIEKKINLCIKDKGLYLFDEEGKISEGTRWAFSIYITIADSDGRARIERFARGKAQKALNGCYVGGNRKFGYTFKQLNKYNNIEAINILNENDTKYIEHPIEGNIVRKIFELYSEGNLGIFGVYNKIKLECTLKPKTISKILKDISYTGEVRNEKKFVQNKKEIKYYKRSYPPLITKELFNKCREVSAKNNTNLAKTQTVYYGHGLLKCRCCGGLLKALKPKMIYRCINRYPQLDTQTKCTGDDSININIIEFLLWKIAKNIEAHTILESNEQKKQEYQTKINELQTEINNSETVYQMAISNKINDLKTKIKILSDDNIKGIAIIELADFKKEIEKKNIERAIETNRLKKLIENSQNNYGNATALIYKQIINVSELEKMIENNTENNDLRRREIIKQHIKCVSVYNEPTEKNKRIKKIEISLYNNKTHTYYYEPMKSDKQKRLYYIKETEFVGISKLYIDYTERFKIN